MSDISVRVKKRAVEVDLYSLLPVKLISLQLTGFLQITSVFSGLEKRVEMDIQHRIATGNSGVFGCVRF